jgi:hypothetical protein
LKPFVDRQPLHNASSDASVPADDNDSDSDTPDDGRVYDIEKIVDRRSRKNSKQYLIHWAGFSSKHRTWEPVKNIFDKNLIAEFEASYTPKTKRLSKHFKGKA